MSSKVVSRPEVEKEVIRLLQAEEIGDNYQVPKSTRRRLGPVFLSRTPLSPSQSWREERAGESRADVRLVQDQLASSLHEQLSVSLPLSRVLVRSILKRIVSAEGASEMRAHINSSQQ